MGQKIGRIIVLDGTAASGRAALAAAVQDQAPTPWVRIGFDALCEAGIIPWRRFERKELDWSAHRDSIVTGWHLAVTAFVSAGNDVIVEHTLDTPTLRDGVRQLWDGADVRWVKVRAAADDAPADGGMSYDLEIEGGAPVAEAARAVLALFEGA